MLISTQLHLSLRYTFNMAATMEHEQVVADIGDAMDTDEV
jgi:hypothetical protein